MLVKILGTVYFVIIMIYILKIFFEALRNMND